MKIKQLRLNLTKITLIPIFTVYLLSQSFSGVFAQTTAPVQQPQIQPAPEAGAPGTEIAQSPDPTNPVQVAQAGKAKDAACGTLEVLTFGHDPCGAVQDGWNKVSDIPGTIFGWLKDNIVDLFTNVFAGLGALLGLMTGFNPCSAVPGFAEHFGFCNSVAFKAPNTFNVFSFFDLGIAGVYKSFPDKTPPSYLADTFRNNIFGIGSANAQGVGTDSLQAIKSTWQKILDLSLTFMVLVMLAISFMIMLRKKLPDRSVVSALNALPRIGISLVLMVFSFAISGLFIDFVYLSVNMTRNYLNDGVLGGVFGFFSNKLGGELIWFPVFTLFSGATIIDWHGLYSTLNVAAYVVGPLLYILALIPELMIRIALFGVAIWLFWKLITTFATMIALVIFSPLFFLIGAIPGFETTTTDWFKRMAAAALVFPAVIFILHIGLGLMFLSNPIGQYFFSGTIKAPPPIGSNIVNIPYLLGLGFIFFATKLPSFFEELFQVKGAGRGGLSPGGMIFAPVSAYSNITNSRTSPINSVKPITQRISNMSIPKIVPFLGGKGIPGAGALDNLVTKVGNRVYTPPHELWNQRAQKASGAKEEAGAATREAQGAAPTSSEPPVDSGRDKMQGATGAETLNATQVTIKTGQTTVEGGQTNTPPPPGGRPLHQPDNGNGESSQ